MDLKNNYFEKKNKKNYVTWDIINMKRPELANIYRQVAAEGGTKSDHQVGTEVNTLKSTDLHTLNRWILWHVNYISIKLLLVRSLYSS